MDHVLSQRTPKLLNALTVTTAVALCVALYLIFFVAPVERHMGIVQKIFYFHVPCAYGMYVGFITAAVASAAPCFACWCC